MDRCSCRSFAVPRERAFVAPSRHWGKSHRSVRADHSGESGRSARSRRVIRSKQAQWVLYASATTGVGKTELCKALAEVLFDSADAMIQVDMSEFMEKHSVARLIGAPRAMSGMKRGLFDEAVRRKPYSLILLDEVEKVHNDVFNILLQVLDDGRLTDGHGRTVDFSNCVLVMTSNLGSEAIQTFTQDSADNDNVEAFNQRLNDMVMGIVAQHFRPEFINRIDDVVVFKPLSSITFSALRNCSLAC